MPQKLEEIFAEHLGKSVFTGIYNLPANTWSECLKKGKKIYTLKPP